MMARGDIVIGYVRVSTREQGDSGAGLEAQRRMIRKFCSDHGYVLSRIEEDVYTGASAKRAGLKRAIDDVEAGHAAGIVPAKLDRFCRSLIDFLNLFARSRDKGWSLDVCDFPLDMETPYGELLASTLVGFAQLERRLISQRTKDALAVKASQGVILGRRSTLAPEIRARIRDMRDAGHSYAAIARWLNDNDVPTGQGGKRWYHSSVAKAAKAREINSVVA